MPLRRHRDPERALAPTWPQRDGSQPHVLIEHPDPTTRQVLADGLQTRGYAVLTCGGPRAAGMTEVSCPLLRQQHCPGVDGADVVFCSLPLRGVLERVIIRRIARNPGDRSLIVEAAPQEAEKYLDEVLVDGTVAPLTVANVATALGELDSACRS